MDLANKESHLLLNKLKEPRATHLHSWNNRELSREERKLHEEAYNCYNHAIQILRNNGNVSIMTAKRCITRAQEIEEELKENKQSLNEDRSKQMRRRRHYMYESGLDFEGGGTPHEAMEFHKGHIQKLQKKLNYHKQQFIKNRNRVRDGERDDPDLFPRMKRKHYRF